MENLLVDRQDVDRQDVGGQDQSIMLCPDVLAHIIQYCYMNIMRRSNALATHRHAFANELLVRASAREDNMFASLPLVCRSWYDAVLDFIRGPDYIAHYERRCVLSKYIRPRRFILMTEIGNMSFYGSVCMNNKSSVQLHDTGIKSSDKMSTNVTYRYSIMWFDYNQAFLKRPNQKITVTFMGSDPFRQTRLIFIGPTVDYNNIIALYNISKIVKPQFAVHIKGCKCCSKNNSDDHVANSNSNGNSLGPSLYRAVGSILQDCPEFRYVFNIMFKGAAIVGDMGKEPASADDMAALAALL